MLKKGNYPFAIEGPETGYEVLLAKEATKKLRIEADSGLRRSSPDKLKGLSGRFRLLDPSMIELQSCQLIKFSLDLQGFAVSTQETTSGSFALKPLIAIISGPA